jgi:hypothetical protein
MRLRVQHEGSGYYYAALEPRRGRAQLYRYADGAATLLDERGGLSYLLQTDGPQRQALRAQGSNLWLLLNDQPILFATDSRFTSGGLAVGLIRLGDPDDEQEVGVTVSRLRLSALQDSPADRLPTYVAP